MKLYETIKSIIIPKEEKEKRLALHISGISFVVFMMILWGIIFWSYIYQTDRIKRDFLVESRIFETDTHNPKIQDMLTDITRWDTRAIDWKRRWWGPRWPRDLIVLDDQGNVIKNDIFDLDEQDIRYLSRIQTGNIDATNIDEREYLFYKIQNTSYSIIFFRDLSAIQEFHIRLAILALIASNLAFIIIYILAWHLARITIEPIREHNASLESYNHNVAHELKTPLAIMRSNLELLRLKPEQKLIDSTEEEVESMEKIIDTLLLIAKPTLETHIDEVIDLRHITQSIIDEYNNPEITLHAPKKKIPIRWNTELFKRILMNLIDNALKYKSTWLIDITLEPNSLTISNHIEKDIPHETLKKLTQAFYQGDISHHTSGHGLGLALVQKIIDISGWKLQLDSREQRFIAKVEW